MGHSYALSSIASAPRSRFRSLSVVMRAMECFPDAPKNDERAGWATIEAALLPWGFTGRRKTGKTRRRSQKTHGRRPVASRSRHPRDPFQRQMASTPPMAMARAPPVSAPGFRTVPPAATPRSGSNKLRGAGDESAQSSTETAGAYMADVSISQIIDNERSFDVRNFPPFSEPTRNTPYADQ